MSLMRRQEILPIELTRTHDCLISMDMERKEVSFGCINFIEVFKNSFPPFFGDELFWLVKPKEEMPSNTEILMRL
jgi:hypothetical protein